MIVLLKREKIAKKNHYPTALLNTLNAFYTLAAAAQWQTPQEVLQTFPTANVLKNGRVIFDIADKYHLGVKINYQMQAMQILFLEPYGKLSEILQNNA